MTALTWDKAGDRIFQTGIDRGVLYLPNKAVPWNGLTSIEEDSTSESAEAYLDGVKYLQVQTPGDFSGTLKAYTYPPEFEDVLGHASSSVAGVRFHDQQPKSFGLSYRTRIGNDLNGVDHGYRIHILYDLVALPDARDFSSMQSSIAPIEFGWKLSATPTFLPGRRPTSHVSLDSTEMRADVLAGIESLLYGNSEADPYLPPFEQLGSILGLLVVVGNSDGTVTFMDHYDRYTSEISPGVWTVQIHTTDDIANSTQTFDQQTL